MNKQDKILITGAEGFVGSTLGVFLAAEGFTNVLGVGGTRQGVDLGDDSDLGWVFDLNPDVVIHLATRLPTKENCLDYPAGMMYENVFVTSKVLEEARLSGCKKFITMWDSSCYPERQIIPYKESELWDGCPHWTKRYYGNSAKVMMEMTMAFATQFSEMSCINLIAPEIYGPNSGFNPNKNKIIESAITNIRVAQDHDRDLTISGSSGLTRDFIYISDVIRALYKSMTNEEESGVYNVSEGIDYSLKELHEIVAEQCDFKGSIFWDEEKQDIQERTCLNISLAKKELGWKPLIDLKKGIEKTLEYHDLNLTPKYVRKDSIIQQ
jgi:GDP-L-fucose synthase